MKNLLLSAKWTVPLLCFLALLFSNGIYGKDGQRSIFDLMHFQEVLDMTLEADFGLIKANRRKDDTYKGQLVFRDEKGKRQTWDVKLSVRGAFRRIHCTDIPPLKFDFKKSELRAAGLSEHDDLKLVTYCMGTEEAARDALLREYLTYKMFNALSVRSFRVQLLRITYKDTATKEKSVQFAFLIEDTAQLRERLGAGKVDEKNAYNLPPERFDRDHLKTVAVFQYMIGNTDWSLNTYKNLKLMEEGGKIIAVPYDFDFTGLTNAVYFAPSSDYGLTSRHQRVYLGFPDDIGHLHTAIHAVAGRRPLLEHIVRNFKLLSPASRKDMRTYLTAFFDNPDVVRPGERVLAGPTGSVSKE